MNDQQDRSSPGTRAAPGSRCGVDAMEAIYARRSVRAYTNQRVGQELVHALIDAALQTCPIGLTREALNEAQTKLEFKIPAEHSVVIPILVGYPRELGPRPPRREARIHSWK